ncbi:intraflagellar transport protein 22 homolog [Rhopilema esculentum]|uniref:intraflagellar transport protein 22 homolog n=1 Tax=Rhopilema esculentum TaxID=499914 RepID=UPI0031DEA26B
MSFVLQYREAGRSESLAELDAKMSRRQPKRSIRKRRTKYIGMFKAKVLVIGPCEVGKTVLSNYLADATEMSSGEYYPTEGVRILEFEVESVALNDGRSANVEVELWDCSGNHKFENCWPAIQKDTNGVVFVLNPEKSDQVKDLDNWYLHFVRQQGIKDSQCMVFVHHKPGQAENARANLSSNFSRIRVSHTNLEDDPDGIKEVFRQYLENIVSNLADRRDQEELSIVNNRQSTAAY